MFPDFPTIPTNLPKATLAKRLAARAEELAWLRDPIAGILTRRDYHVARVDKEIREFHSCFQPLLSSIRLLHSPGYLPDVADRERVGKDLLEVKKIQGELQKQLPMKPTIREFGQSREIHERFRIERIKLTNWISSLAAWTPSGYFNQQRISLGQTQELKNQRLNQIHAWNGKMLLQVDDLALYLQIFINSFRAATAPYGENVSQRQKAELKEIAMGLSDFQSVSSSRAQILLNEINDIPGKWSVENLQKCIDSLGEPNPRSPDSDYEIQTRSFLNEHVDALESLVSVSDALKPFFRKVYHLVCAGQEAIAKERAFAVSYIRAKEMGIVLRAQDQAERAYRKYVLLLQQVLKKDDDDLADCVIKAELDASHRDPMMKYTEKSLSFEAFCTFFKN